METLGGVRVREQTEQNLLWNIKQWDDNGFGLWMFYEKDTGLFIGCAGLRQIDVDGKNEIELALCCDVCFLEKRICNGNGPNSVKIAFDILKLRSLVAKTRKTNLASQHIIVKLGFSFEKALNEYGHDQKLYRLLKKSAT